MTLNELRGRQTCQLKYVPTLTNWNTHTHTYLLTYTRTRALRDGARKIADIFREDSGHLPRVRRAARRPTAASVALVLARTMPEDEDEEHIAEMADAADGLAVSAKNKKKKKKKGGGGAEASTATGMLTGPKPAPLGLTELGEPSDPSMHSSPVGGEAREAERPLLQEGPPPPPPQDSMARPDGGCDSPELSAATEGGSEPAPSTAADDNSEPTPLPATGGDSEPASTGAASEPTPAPATGAASEPTPLAVTWSDSELPALSAASAARRLSRIEATLLGLGDAATFVRPWAALHSVQRGACATAQRRVAQHTELVLQADAAVLTKVWAALHADVRGIAAIQAVDSAPVAHRACTEQLEQQHRFLEAAASEDEARAAQSEQRILATGARLSSERAAQSEALRAAARQAGSQAAEHAAAARGELHAAMAQVSEAHVERRARLAAAIAGAARQLAREEAALAARQERLRAAATSARELGRRREEGHAAALHHLRQPMVAALAGMKKAAVSGKLQLQREQLEQEVRAVQRRARVQHLCWLRGTSELLSDAVRTIGAHLDAAEAEQRTAPLGASSQRHEARIEALAARIERLEAEVHSF